MTCAHQWHVIKGEISQIGAGETEEPRSNFICLSFGLEVTVENQTYNSKIGFIQFLKYDPSNISPNELFMLV